MRKTRLAGGLAGFTALLFSFNALADAPEDERGAISDVWVFAVKRDREAEFTAAMKEHIAVRKELGEPRKWHAYRAEVGKHPGLIMYRSPPTSYAEHDAYLDSDRSAVVEAFNETIDPLVEHYHHYIDSYDWKNSHWPDDATTAGPLYTVVTRKWRPGGGYASEQARERMSRIALNDGWAEKGYEWLWVDRIGGAPVQSIVFPAANYAETAPTGEEFGAWLAGQVGSEESAEIIGTWLSGFSAADVTIWRYDPRISTPSDD
ncbi:MAG: hypothetical protein MJA32_07905 [Proteobacteria bacterium]|nr:hypothetical protein [Pseudomonadota bacterium]